MMKYLCSVLDDHSRKMFNIIDEYIYIYIYTYIITTLHYIGPIERSRIQGVLKLKDSHQLLVNADGTHFISANKHTIKKVVNI